MPGELSDLSTIFIETWEQYKKRAFSVIGLMLVSFGIILVAGVAFILIGTLVYGTSFIKGSTVFQGNDIDTLINMGFSLAIPVFFLCIWNYAAVIALIMDENLRFSTALKKGWQYFLPFCWVCLLLAAVFAIGFSFFIIPVILFFIWFIFSPFILFDKQVSGIDALIISREYVRGYGFNIFIKLSAILCLSCLVLAIAVLFPVLGQFLYYVCTPFVLLYLAEIYKELKKVNSEVTVVPNMRHVWNGVALVGLLPLVILAFGGAQRTLASFKDSMTPRLSFAIPDNDLRLICDYLDDGNLPECEKAQFVETKVFWNDLPGDVPQDGVTQKLDIRSVSIENREATMHLAVKLNDSVTSFSAAAKKAGVLKNRLCTIYLDSDLNEDTGGTGMPQASRHGYDQGMDVILEAVDGGDLPKIFVNFFNLDGSVRSETGETELTGASVNIVKEELVVSIPYGLIGVSAGSLSRLCYHESAQGALKGVSMDLYLAFD